jgi:aminobenzoyl-glutamate transport protein
MDPLSSREWYGLGAGLAVVGVGLGLLIATSWPAESPWRAPAKAPPVVEELRQPIVIAVGGCAFGAGKEPARPNSYSPAESPSEPKERELLTGEAPLMKSIVPLMFLAFLLPGIVYGYVAGTIRTHRDIIQGMSKSMGTMSYYLVLAFVAAQFIYAFTESNVGILIAMKGGEFLKGLGVGPMVVIVGVVILSTLFNLLIGSASAKWALLAPIFVPMLMQLGLSPELTQAAYRIGDSCTNIITPLMPYFPLVVVYCQRYVKSAGIGSVVSLMLPYSLSFLACWTVLLLGYWALGLPLGIAATYTYPP